ncbi:MAG: hypothetical protein OER12_09875 [Acidimicrobiia bacterium]|nr:hypothetical protein [Acidimicrobiia bacterium]
MDSATRDEWSDPIALARLAAEGLLELTRGNWVGEGLDATRQIRSRRPDHPLMLAVTEPALDPDPYQASLGLGSVLSVLGDQSWANDIGMEISEATSIGVLSLHHESLWALESAALLGATQAGLFTDRRAVARGLGYLRLPLRLADPATADVLLLPGIARDDATMWTYRRFAAVSWRATGKIVPVIHPGARLSPLNRKAFRPPAGVYAIELP